MRLRPIALDFESEPIRRRPQYPPKPVSFSLQMWSWRKPRFYAWGHKTGGNNCSFDDARRALIEVYREVSREQPLLCHNGKFDMDIAEEHFGLAVPPWDHFEDTMLLLFLHDPHSRELALKPAAERLLGEAPSERDAVHDWILQHKAQLEHDYPEILDIGVDPKSGRGGIKPSNCGAFIAYAPADLVGPYADGDIKRTVGLWKLLKPEVLARGMGLAYDRERKVLPILLRNEQEGIRVNEAALEKDLVTYEGDQTKCDEWLRKALRAPSLDFNKDAEVGKALEDADAVSQWTLTATGKNSVSKKNMKLSHFRDPKVGAAYAHRQKCATILETFIRPWMRCSSGGWMSTNWNQVRQAGKAGGTGGTRTGRPSSNDPNFLNMPKKIKDATENAASQYMFPKHIKGLHALPKVRSYILPDFPDHVIGRRDFNQQEVRILAHFEDGLLMQSYLEDPMLDVHGFLMGKLVEMGLNISRTEAKNMNFGFIYGQGMGGLAMAMDRPVDVVKSFRNAQMTVLPGLKELSDSIKVRSRAGQPIRTWGGREYYVEPPKMIDGQLRDYTYKLINYLCQGSAADITKESIIRYDETQRDGRFMLSVYDENNISAPKGAIKSEMLILREAMMSIELDVPLISEGEWGPDLGSLVDLEEPKPDLSRWGIKNA